MLRKLRAAGLIWPSAFAIAMFAFLIGLGTWQMQRKSWKDNLVAQIDARVGAPPGDLARMLALMLEAPPPKDGYLAGAVLDDMAYTPYRVSGVFDHSGERHYYAPDPRLGPGYHVFTPLRLAGQDSRGIYLMVNRGFVPEQMKDARARPAGNVQGSVTVTGLLRIVGKKGAFTPDNDPVKNIWFWPDPATMSGRPTLTETTANAGDGRVADRAKAGVVLPFVLDALAEPANPGGWPRGGTTMVAIPNRHLEYALTWYGLAATLVGVYLAFTMSRLRSLPAAD